MRLLVDQNLPPRLALLLVDAGHDAVHVGVGLASAPDPEILDLATEADRMIVSADTDFGALLALTKVDRHEVIRALNEGRDTDDER